MSAHNRSAGSGILSAPTRPRGGGGPPPRGPSSYSIGPTSRSATFNQGGPPPSGPRGSFGRGSSESYDRPPPSSSYSRGPSHEPTNPPPFRHSNNSTSATYPRTQHFNSNSNPVSRHFTPAEKLIVPGGKLLPSGLPLDQERRMKQLELDAEKLRETIVEKQKLKRQALREWDDRERESESAGMRSELAERHLEKLTEGEDGMGGVAF